jgi:hypothetical protein
MTLFDILRDIQKDKTGALDQEPDFEKEFSGYMVIRFLSMADSKGVRDVALQAAALNLHDLGNKELYRYLVSAVPATKNTFIKYLKKPAKAEKAEKAKKRLPSPRP